MNYESTEMLAVKQLYRRNSVIINLNPDTVLIQFSNCQCGTVHQLCNNLNFSYKEALKLLG